MKEIIVYIIAYLAVNSVIYSTRVIFNYGTAKIDEFIGYVLSIVYLMLVVVSFLIWTL